MTTPNLNQKSLNRLRQQIADLHLGILPDVGEKHAKGYRFRLGNDAAGTSTRFWLGHIESEAKHRAGAYVETWLSVVMNGRNYWTAADLKAAREMGDQRVSMLARFGTNVQQLGTAYMAMASTQHARQARLQSPEAVIAPPPAPAKVVMLHDALDQYAKAFAETPNSDSYKAGVKDTMAAIKHYRSDCPLAEVDFAWLESFTNTIKGRPLSRIKGKNARRSMPISPFTVSRILQHSRQAFKWLHRQQASERFGGWKAPADYQELFSVDMNRIRTKAERDKAADGPDQITIDEIVKLYKAANSDLHRLVILMGCFTGQGQTELSCTRRDEFDFDNATFVHRRSKTGQRGEFWLPPELATMLKGYFAKHEAGPDDLAFRTRAGSPLVTKASDSVRQAIDDFKKRAGITRTTVTFYAFRRFLADRAARKGGDSLRDTALAHAPQSVGGRHYSNYRDFSALKVVAQELHAELTAAGMFDGKPLAMPENQKPTPKPRRKAA